MKEKDNFSISQNSENNNEKKKKKNKNISKSSRKEFISQLNKVNRLKCYDFESQEESSFKSENKSFSIKKELYKTCSKFLYRKKFKLSNEFDARHSKKFLEQKNKYLERIVLSDVIVNDDEMNDNLYIKETQCDKKSSNTKKSYNNRRKSGAPKNFLKNYCIVVSNYDDETIQEKTYNFTVKNSARKLSSNPKKNKHLSKYFNNSEAKSQS